MEAKTVATEARPTKNRGNARMREIARETAAERAAEEDRLLADLGREPSATERLLVEQAAALAVRSRRLRAVGREREAADATRLLVRAIGKLTAVKAPKVAHESPGSSASVAAQSGASSRPVGVLAE